MANVTDGRPRHQQIAAELRALIMSCDLAPGSQLPTTQQLMDQYKVGSPTVQRALTVLKNEGFIVGRRGAGVYVREREPIIVDATNYFDPTPDGFSYDILDVAEVRPPVDAAKILGLPAGGVAVLRHRLMRFVGDPVELDWSYYPVDLARGTKLSSGRKIRGGAKQVLADLGFPEERFADVNATRAPTTKELELLELPGDVGVIRQLRTMYSAGDRPITVSVLVKAGNRFAVRYHQTVH